MMWNHYMSFISSLREMFPHMHFHYTRQARFVSGSFFYEPYPITEDNFNIYKEKIWSSLGQFTPSVS